MTERANTFGEMTQNNNHPSRSFKDTDFGTNRKPVYNFLLVNNTNLHYINLTGGGALFNALVQGDPLNLVL